MSRLAAVFDSTQTGEGRAWWFLDTLVVEHPTATDGVPVVLEVTLPRGAAPPLHVHRDMDDSWYLLEGEMVVHCGDRIHLATPGDWVSMPRGVPHAFRVVGQGPARVLMVHGNETFLDLVRDLGQAADTRQLPIPTGGPGLEELNRALAAHDITTVGPSMTEDEAEAFVAAHGQLW